MAGGQSVHTKSAVFLYFALRSGILVFAAWLLVMVEPFGIATALDRASGRIYSLLSAPFQTLPERDEVVVILIDDESLREWEETWPVRRDRVAGLALQLQAIGVEAVFLDLFFHENRGGNEETQTLADTAYLLNQSDPGFLSVAHLQNHRAQLFDLGGAASSYSILAPSDHYNLCSGTVPAEGESAEAGDAALARYEPFTAPASSSMCPSSTPHPSPALAFYERHCLRTGAAASACDSLSALDLGSQELSIRWPWTPAPSVDQNTCLNGDSEGLQAFFGLLRTQIAGSEADRESSVQICAPINTYSAHDLPGFNVDDPRLAGKYVFVGADTTEAGDVYRSPVHGAIPGVYTHAMAFVNLLADGADFRRAYPPQLWGADLNDWLQWFLIVVTILAIATYRLLVWLKEREKDPMMAPQLAKPGSLNGQLIAALILLVTPCVVGIAFALIFNSAPMNWVGFLLLNIGLAFDVLNERLDEALRGACAFLSAALTRLRDGLRARVLAVLTRRACPDPPGATRPQDRDS